MEAEVTDDELVLRMARAEALVLFEWIMRVDPTRALPVDPAEQEVLWSIEAKLEGTLVEPLDRDYAALLAAAKKAVLDRA